MKRRSGLTRAANVETGTSSPFGEGWRGMKNVPGIWQPFPVCKSTSRDECVYPYLSRRDSWRVRHIALRTTSQFLPLRSPFIRRVLGLPVRKHVRFSPSNLNLYMVSNTEGKSATTCAAGRQANQMFTLVVRNTFTSTSWREETCSMHLMLQISQR